MFTLSINEILIVIFAQSINEIFTKQIKFQKFNLENECQLLGKTRLRIR